MKSEIRIPNSERRPNPEFQKLETPRIEPAIRLKSRFTFHASRIARHFSRAFTLIEVMVACGIFFMATFAILAMVSATLRNARGLQKGNVDAGMAAAQVFQTFKTNTDPDLSLSGDFGESLRDYAWEAQSSEYDTNGLLQVDIVVTKRGNRAPVDTMTILVYQANAKSSAFGAPRIKP